MISWVPPVRSDRGPVAGPLAGLTAGVKDNIEVAGVRSTCASEFFADRVADADATVVRRLRAAGADVVATLNLAEFAVGVTSQNSAAGGARNPWDPRRVPAGSSGGSGAAVAAGLVDVALGTDSGGSVRLPASACGVVGLRPTPGLVDVTGVFPVSADFDTVGPMARSVDLVARVFDVLTDQPRRPRAAPVRIGVPRRFVTDDVDPAIAAAVRACTATLADLGFEVVEVEVPHAEDAQDHVYTLLYADVAEIHRERLHRAPERFQPATLQRIRQGLDIGPAARRAAAHARSDFRAGLRGVFEEVEVVVTPTLPVDVPLAADCGSVLDQSRRLGQLSYPWSLHNGPTLSLPVGFHPSSGMPVGAQLSAARADEEALFAVGRAYQTATDWHTRRPPVRR
ncbi:amidase [Nocardioides pantholopis]|uniref:amidase n=1 Tax=Nocardioides pantholopis TaxID=2483798 RepID=UPI0019D2A895|nr:amidase [Nocardioides pantholopis]